MFTAHIIGREATLYVLSLLLLQNYIGDEYSCLMISVIAIWISVMII